MRTILVATDGEPGGRGALRLAAELSARDGARVVVVSVMEPVLLYPPGGLAELAAYPPLFAAGAETALRERVRLQLVQLGGRAAAWEVHVGTGSFAPTVARIAADYRAELILLGLRGVGRLEKWISREALVRLIHLSSVPILAVPAEGQPLPDSAAVAVDFSAYSTRAAHVAAELLGPGGELHLIHVTWTPPAESGWSDTLDWTVTYRSGVERRLELLEEELRESHAVKVHRHLLLGDPAHEIQRLARKLEPDLLCVGSHGTGFIGRILLGGVSTKIVHSARSAVLIAPPRELPREVRVEIGEREVLAELGAGSDLALSARARLTGAAGSGIPVPHAAPRADVTPLE